MSHMDGMEVLERVKTWTPETEVMVITAHGSIERVVEAMKLGAADFITKPFSSEEFGVKVDRLVADRAERQRLRRENVALRVSRSVSRTPTCGMRRSPDTVRWWENRSPCRRSSGGSAGSPPASPA